MQTMTILQHEETSQDDQLVVVGGAHVAVDLSALKTFNCVDNYKCGRVLKANIGYSDWADKIHVHKTF